MFWPKKDKENEANAQAKGESLVQKASSCGHVTACPRCGYLVEGLALVCPRCREELPRGCSGNCSSCGK